MANRLSTEVELIGVEKAFQQSDELQRRFIEMEGVLDQFGANREFGKNILENLIKVNEQVSSFDKQLSKTIRFDVNTSSLDSMSKKALALRTPVREIANELAKVRVLMTTETDPKVLDKLNLDAITLEQNLLKAENRIASLQRKRDAADKAAAARDSGRLSNVRGAGNIVGQFAPELGGTINQAISAGVELQQLTGITLGTAGAFVAVGAAIFGAGEIAKRYRDEQKRLLKVQESISIAVNEEVAARKKAAIAFAEARKQAEIGREFGSGLEENNVEQLKAQLAIRQKLLAIAPKGANADRFTQEALAIEAKLAAIENKKTIDADAAFNQRNEDYKKSLEERVNLTKKAYDRILANADATVSQIQAGLKAATVDVDLKPEDQASTIKAFQDRLKQQNESLIQLRDTTVQFLLDVKSEDNPLAKLMFDFENATKSAKKEFGIAGDEYVAKIAEIKKASIADDISKTIFASNLKALKLEQEANRLDAAPQNDRDGFQRRLDTVTKTVDAVANLLALTRQVDEAKFFSQGFNINNPRSFDQNRFGEFEASRLGETGIAIKDALDSIGKLSRVGIDSTGIEGKGAIADRILSLIPKREDLLNELRSSDGDKRSNAQSLLSIQSEQLQLKLRSEEQKFQNFIESQKVFEQSKKDAIAQIGLAKSGNLSPQELNAQILAITGELPASELDGNLRKARIDALRANATEERKAKEKANEVNDLLKTFISQINGQLVGQGLKVDLGNQAITQLTITSKELDVESQRKKAQEAKPSQRDVDREYKQFQSQF